MTERVKRWTKGQWNRISDETLYIRTSNGERVAILTQLKGKHGLGGRRDRDEVKANSFVMASAPDLVEALEDLLATNGGGTKSCGHDFTCICAEDKAKAALARAYGETN